MSFANIVKNELARIEPEQRCCRIAQLAGLVRMDGTILIGSKNSLTLELVTENAAIARMAFKEFKNLFQIEAELTVQRRNRLKRNNVYQVRLPSDGKVLEVLNVLGLTQDGLIYNPTVKERLVRKDCCKKSYLRGVFLGSGSLSDPQNSYHLEIVTNSEEYSESLVKFMESMGLEPKISSRKQNLVVYFKESEQIILFLGLIGAHNALLKLEDIRIQKEMRNNINRMMNCEIANINKTVTAAARQVENIELIAQKIGFAKLPYQLRAVAEARLANPEVSLKELGELMEPPLGKSGINHRMRKIEEIADDLRNGIRRE